MTVKKMLHFLDSERWNTEKYLQVMGKRAKLYGRAYAESLGCLKSDTTEEVGRT